MSGIFPPLNQGGVPPSTNTCNSYTPTNGVIGEGPLYVSANCTTTLTDCMFNSVISEILAAVDLLGFSYNANRVDNLGQAITARLQATGDGQWVIRTGDTMTGALHLPPVMPVFATQAVHKAYVDSQTSVLQANIDAAVNTARLLLQAEIDKKVNRSGDTMTGVLILNRDPVLALEAATRQYVDALFTSLGAKMIGHAPSTNQYYGSYNGAWQTIPIQSDAPSNGQDYARRNGGWVVVQTGGTGGLEDAPSDGSYYARRNGAWASFTVDGGGGGPAGDYVLRSGDTMTGDLTLPNLKATAEVTASAIYVDPLGATARDFGLFKTYPGTITQTAVLRMAAGFAFVFDNYSAGWQWHYSGAPVLMLGSSGRIDAMSALTYKPGGGPWDAGSDARIKEVLGDYTTGLAAIEQLRPVVYRYLGNDSDIPEHDNTSPPAHDLVSPHAQVAEERKEFVGLVAQDVESIMPELVSQIDGYIDGKPVTDLRTMNTGPLLFALLNAVQELSARVAALEAAR